VLLEKLRWCEQKGVRIENGDWLGCYVDTVSPHQVVTRNRFPSQFSLFTSMPAPHADCSFLACIPRHTQLLAGPAAGVRCNRTSGLEWFCCMLEELTNTPNKPLSAALYVEHKLVEWIIKGEQSNGNLPEVQTETYGVLNWMNTWCIHK